MYDVVAAVEHYSAFVPWCQRSAVLLRRPAGAEEAEAEAEAGAGGYLEAELEVGFQVFVER